MRCILGHGEVLRNDLNSPGFAPLRITGGLTFNGMGDLQAPTMGTIHNKRVFVAGLITGAVLSMSDVLLYGSVLKAPMEAAWRAAGRPTMTDLQRTFEVPASIFLDFVVGIVLMWLYAAIQPRFRAGLGTAVRAGLVAWSLATLLCAAFMFQGVMPLGIIVMPLGIMNITILVLLVEYPLAVVLGAKLYTDGSATAPLRLRFLEIGDDLERP